MKRLLGLVALLALTWLHRRREDIEDHVAIRREMWRYRSVDSASFTELDAFYSTLPDPADGIQVDPSLHERAGL